ncbi:hypothetical protein DTL42_19575 [Bremerella cremea]|uniref:Uncharacterized protein n=1 Tax=Bremerella cremea TaxID=1031537 RepID=A0A368KQP1_9BACT|nr:hypothetical protein [Bremerella cremea]RCS42273.1 hypothetical protein DTL42_19575 [Bremerella cremea]
MFNILKGWFTRSKGIFKIPNSFMVPEPIQQRLRSLFAAVESTKEFHHFKKKRWTVDRAELVSNAAVHAEYVKAAQAHRREWGTGLQDAISGVTELAVFGVCVHSREGLEHHPDHVLGPHFTFFVDAKTSTTLFVIESTVSR